MTRAVETGSPRRDVAGALAGDLRTARTSLALLASAQFLIAVDYNIVYVALPDIGQSLQFTPQTLQWVVSAYALAFGGLLLLGGRAADRLGARRMFILALLIYGGSSLLGTLAPTKLWLIAARVAQGAGGALLFPATLALISLNFSQGRERQRALVIWGVAGTAGLAAGSMLGGALTQAFGWPAVFFVNVPLALGAAALAKAVLVPDGTMPRDSSFDLSGGLLATLGVTLIVFGLVSGPENGWSTWQVAISIPGGLVLLGLLFWVEAHVPDPLIASRMLRHRELSVAIGIAFLFQASLNSQFYLFTVYLQQHLKSSALQTGLAFLPLTLISALVGRPADIALTRWGLRSTMLVGMFLNGIGMAIFAWAMLSGGSYIALLPGVIVWAIGGGLAWPCLYIAASVGVEPREQGVASALVSTSQQLGGAIGLAAILIFASGALAYNGPTPQTLGSLGIAGFAAGGASIIGAAIALFLRTSIRGFHRESNEHGRVAVPRPVRAPMGRRQIPSTSDAPSASNSKPAPCSREPASS